MGEVGHPVHDHVADPGFPAVDTDGYDALERILT